MEALLASVSKLIDSRQFDEVGIALDEAELEVRMSGVAAIAITEAFTSSQRSLFPDRHLTRRIQARCHRSSGHTRCICLPMSMRAACEPPPLPPARLAAPWLSKCMPDAQILWEPGKEGVTEVPCRIRPVLTLAPLRPVHLKALHPHHPPTCL